MPAPSLRIPSLPVFNGFNFLVASFFTMALQYISTAYLSREADDLRLMQDPTVSDNTLHVASLPNR